MGVGSIEQLFTGRSCSGKGKKVGDREEKEVEEKGESEEENREEKAETVKGNEEKDRNLKGKIEEGSEIQ